MMTFCLGAQASHDATFRPRRDLNITVPITSVQTVKAYAPPDVELCLWYKIKDSALYLCKNQLSDSNLFVAP